MLEIHPVPARAVDVVREVLEQFKPGFIEREIKVELEVKDTSLVKLDTDFLQQILGNLFSNIEKYAASGKSLRIEIERAGSQTLLTFKDRGPGISRENRQKIFEPFYRSSNSLTDGISGAGIGLSISRDLAHLHGGDLLSLPSTEGAVFLLTLEAPLVSVQNSSK